MYNDESPIPTSSFLPVPRVPAAVGYGWPEPDRLDGLVDGAGKPVREAEEIRVAVRTAVAELEECRPGGRRWAEARASDREKLASEDHRKRGKPAALAALLREEPDRYARALAECSTASARLDERRARVGAVPGLLEAVDKASAEISEDLGELTFRFFTRAKSGTRSEGYSLLEEVEDLKVSAAWIRGLKAWLFGHDHAFDAIGHGAGMSSVHAEWYRDGIEVLDPPAKGESWRDRENERRSLANLKAITEGRPIPHPRPLRTVAS